MAELKTKPNDRDVRAFLDELEDERQRQDCYVLLDMMREATGDEPRMWGKTIVGFGVYDYRYANGREGRWFLVGFAPRRRNLTLYIMPGFARYQSLLTSLGRHSTGKSCLYIKRLADVDQEILHELVQSSVAEMEELKQE